MDSGRVRCRLAFDGSSPGIDDDRRRVDEIRLGRNGDVELAAQLPGRPEVIVVEERKPFASSRGNAPIPCTGDPRGCRSIPRRTDATTRAS